MKSIIAYVLASVMLLSATACGRTVPDDTVSSTASASEQILIERLGEIPANVILGDAAVAAEYGIDMTDFEDEGYIVRTAGDSTLVFGKTENGLERAARYFANYVYGNDTPVNVTYGEGERVKSFTVEGHRISEFVITVTEAHPDGSYPESTNYAATELASLIKQATGVTVPVVKEKDLTAEQPHFRFTCDGSGENGEEGFTVTVTPEGNVEILGGLKRGCLFAAYDIAEKWLGMRFISIDYTYIYESEHIDITSEDSYTDAPLMDLRWPSSSSRNPGLTGFTAHASFNVKNKINGGISHVKYGYTPLRAVSHGLYKYWLTDSAAANLCFTSDEVFDLVVDYLGAELETAKENGTYDEGNYYHVNLGQNDNPHFCLCVNCLKVQAEEGAFSGVYARFVTRVADYFAEDYPRAMFGMFAYYGTEEPCKTPLPDNVFVEYCIVNHCMCGPMDGSECRPERRGLSGFTAAEERENLLGWMKLTENLDVRLYYFAENIATPYNLFQYLREDTAYIYGLGVRSVYVEIEHTTFSYDHPATWVYSKLMWNPLMSEEEYNDLVAEIMTLWYGDGYTYILGQFDFYDETILCTDRLFWGGDIDYSRYAERSEAILWHFDKAQSLATSEFTEKNVKLIKAHALYNTLCGIYDSHYVNGDAEKREYYENLAAELKDIFELSGATYLDFWKTYKIEDIDWTGDPYDWYAGRTEGTRYDN